MRRWSFAALFAAAGLGVVVACSTFESSGAGGTSEGDASDETATPIDAPIVDPDATTDTGNDAQPACVGEPVWVTPSSPVTTATCDGTGGTSLLGSSNHCGKCGHSCGGDMCADGNCVPRTEDPTGPTLVLGSDSEAIYYARGFGAPTAILRFEPGKTPVTLYTHNVAGDDGYVSAGAISGDKVWFRTRAGLHAVDKKVASDAAPSVATFPYEDKGMLVFYGDVLLTQNSVQQSIDEVRPDGGISTFIASSGYTFVAVGDFSHVVWLSQPFIAGFPGGSGLHTFAGGTRRDLYDVDADVGGLAVSGNSAFVIRRGDAGEVRMIDVADGGATTIHTDNFQNPGQNLDVAVDMTHVYWLRYMDNQTGYEIWKRALCGGEVVRIASLNKDVHRLVSWLDRIYVFSETGVVSIQK